MRGNWHRLSCLFLLLLVATSGAAATPAEAIPESTDGISSAMPSLIDTNPRQVGDDAPIDGSSAESNNSSVLHEDPEDVESESRLDRLASYLSGDLNARIGDSSLQLSQAEYDAAKAAVGDDYSEALEKYVDVDGETDGDGASEEYGTVQETQREYVDTVSEFREAQRAYEDAAADGDDERARELARELSRLADDGESQSDRLLEGYDQISNATGSDLNESSSRIEAIQTDIDTDRREIVAREFVETRLVVGSYDREVSFRDPLVLSGTLETANGTSVDAETAQFAVGDQIVEAAVDADGEFEFTYRPTTVDADTDELEVAYRPAATSVYRGSNATVPVNITQVTAEVETTNHSGDAYGYADSLAVTATVTANGTPVANYPLTASIDGSQLSAATTNASGQSTLTGTVPARIPAGSVDLGVSTDRSDRAVRLDPSTTSLSIVSQPTDLDVSARLDGDDTVVVEGRLRTEDGEVVDAQPITIAVDGRTLETATTGASGAYRTTIDLPATVAEENATVSVAFDGSGTNLDSSAASTGIDPADAMEQAGIDSTDEDANGDLSADRFTLLGVVVGVVVGVGVVGVVTVFLLRRNGALASLFEQDEPTASADDTVTESADGTADRESDLEPASSVERASVVETASDALADGRPNDAVVIAYAGVQQALADRVGASADATHREFYELCVERGIDDPEALETLTDGYEKSAYSGLSVSDREAEALLETARGLLEANVQQ
ncbi:DUF4129 domain-containing protein [Halobellus captivus]|uniref:DUF4129 domain-containing protein n=1 Tax=Halobellus captivus TaxID=2592614 RepID=UPI0011A85229|nr:DUF4129 domain-containing protein [Halobellus captivus]